MFVAFLRVHSNPKEVSYLSWQSKHSRLKSNCYFKLKFELNLWTKLHQNLLLKKYPKSVDAASKKVWQKWHLFQYSVKRLITRNEAAFFKFYISWTEKMNNKIKEIVLNILNFVSISFLIQNLNYLRKHLFCRTSFKIPLNFLCNSMNIKCINWAGTGGQ